MAVFSEDSVFEARGDAVINRHIKDAAAYLAMGAIAIMISIPLALSTEKAAKGQLFAECFSDCATDSAAALLDQ